MLNTNLVYIQKVYQEMGEFEEMGELQYCHKAMLPLRQYLNFGKQ